MDDPFADDPFHEGERHVQERAGERATALRTGGMVGTLIPPRALPFLEDQRMLAIGSVDDRGNVLASVVLGARGLATSIDGSSVILDRTRIDAVDDDDPVWRNLRAGADVGLLAIELESRRRLRVNGVVTSATAERVAVSVREAYPNCPKYIARRHPGPETNALPNEHPAAETGTLLDDERSATIERADTLFVASHHPTRGVDVSHRGGAPGFVRVLDPGHLRIPDYRGNSMFNTLGNFAVDDRAGLLVVDFHRRTFLQMTGTVILHFDEREDPRQPTGGSGRYWDFAVARWIELAINSNVSWELVDYSPHNPRALE